jgi:hypothetical protein
MLQKFWNWYKNNLALNQAIVAVLFGWQLLHLYWLSTHVLAFKILGYSLFNPSEFYQYLLVIADYFEIPALISGTLLYFHSIKEGSVKKNLTFIILINSQWLHLLWLTDEFVLDHFRGEHSYLPIWLAPTPNNVVVWGLAWIAIFIDYLELPVIFDTIKKTIAGILKKN